MLNPDAQGISVRSAGHHFQGSLLADDGTDGDVNFGTGGFTSGVIKESKRYQEKNGQADKPAQNAHGPILLEAGS